jgi:hypothetical protein
VPVHVADPGLQLALIDEVQRRRAGYSWVQSYRASYEALAPEKPWAELEHNDFDHVVELERLLGAIELAPADLLAITSLTLDGDRDLYGWVYPNWWDDGDHFVIRDLTGIEQCAALEYLLLGQGLVVGASLAPLARLAHLRELHACALSGLRDIEALLDLRALGRLSVVNVASSPQRAIWGDVLAELGRRGVAT